MSLLEEQLPPQDIGIEQAVLGTIITYERSQAAGCTLLSPLCFYNQAHQIVFQALQHMHQARETISMLTLAYYLRSQDQLDEVGGLVYLADICGRYADVPTTLPKYAQILKEIARRREHIETGHQLSQEAYRLDRDLAELTREMIQRLQNPTLSDLEKDSSDPEVLAEESLKIYQAAEQVAQSGRAFAGLDTGFHDLSCLVNGLNRAEMTLIAARPSIGKTTMALQIAQHVARHEHQGVGIFTLEMSAAQVVSRLTGIAAGVDPDAQRRGKLNPADRDRLYESIAEFARLPIHVFQDRSLPDIRARMRQLSQDHDIGLWIIDHLHRIAGPGEEYERLSIASEDCANLAIEMDRPLLLLSQLNRECENRSDKKPQLSDLRGSGSIEEHAVNVWMIYRPGFYQELLRRHPEGSREREEMTRQVFIFVEKQRFGPIGFVSLAWVPEKAVFGNPARPSQQDELEIQEHHDNE